VAHVEISQKIFGKNLYNAVISDGFLIAIFTDRTAKLFSFEYILQEVSVNFFFIIKKYHYFCIISREHGVLRRLKMITLLFFFFLQSRNLATQQSRNLTTQQ
jgi:hypothetical protein